MELRIFSQRTSCNVLNDILNSIVVSSLVQGRTFYFSIGLVWIAAPRLQIEYAEIFKARYIAGSELYLRIYSPAKNTSIVSMHKVVSCKDMVYIYVVG